MDHDYIVCRLEATKVPGAALFQYWTNPVRVAARLLVLLEGHGYVLADLRPIRRPVLETFSFLNVERKPFAL